ncbi:hypothetical protein PA7_09260 [Pseudonocardia asaccharolytica DSM 44247 = NBRC 16224]|uniref:Bacterial spore germination immunoglobulin-like domain-containing protein n=1 Tax=Pseudonocardia asaccharolytica DSM 44247 = NBRC 16224 TaxID=1123024 RepID=A0A511CWZ8_9PSEU|nr:hypothetical protein PA7_09260 [Pseudonocardia asaccharolytica DSM 44247 = NBRC 16224]
MLLVLLVAVGCGQPDTDAPGAAPATTNPSTTAPSDSPAPTPDRPGGPTPTVPAFDHQPLWPFPDLDAVRAWQEAHRTGGQQPWHLDAEATALGFTQGYLGFTGIDRVTSYTENGADAWVGVGFALPNGRETTASVLHLARFGDGLDAPWEVVGTRDETLVVDTPAYGSPVTSPVTAGGTITGVDESLRLQLRTLGRDTPVGEFCCVPAGGQSARWSATVPFTDAGAGPMTLVVSTGGHVADVEEFAITAVRAG